MTDTPAAAGPHLAKPIAVIVNTRSRRGRNEFDAALAALRAAGITIKSADAVQDKDESARLLQAEIDCGAETVIVGGGDGTLSECAGHLVHTPVAMAVLPMGTGNTLARSLGIPLEFGAAARAIAGGHAEAMDVGLVNGRVFLNSVTLGLSSEIATELNAETKRRLGLFSWPIIGTWVFLRHRPLSLRVTSKERNFKVRTHEFIVANGRYIAGPVTAAPDASTQSHRLDVFALGGAEKAATFRSALRWLLGRHVHSREEHFFHTEKLQVTSLRHTLHADVDGEIVKATALDMAIDKSALRVVVPAGYDPRTA